MTSFRETMRRGLCTYPSIYPNPANVAVAIFCQSNETWTRWNKAGELEITYGWEHTEMQYVVKESDTPPSLEAKLGHSLRDEAENYRRKWISDNMDRVIEANCTNVYFGSDPRGQGFTTGISARHIGDACAFTFPDNITKDWGDALMDFLDYWQYRINCEYGVDFHGKSYAPPEVKEVGQLIQAAKARLFPLIHNGRTLAQANATKRQLVKKVLAELKKERT